jgi:autotransporter-associated beta strand protein/T5SS/PEP-CTERM-associated repeat protein
MCCYAWRWRHGCIAGRSSSRCNGSRPSAIGGIDRLAATEATAEKAFVRTEAASYPCLFFKGRGGDLYTKSLLKIVGKQLLRDLNLIVRFFFVVRFWEANVRTFKLSRHVAPTSLLRLCMVAGVGFLFLPERAARATNSAEVFQFGTALDTAGDWGSFSVPGVANDAVIQSGWPTSPATLTLGSNQTFGSLDVLNTNPITIDNPTSGNVSTLTLGGTGNQGNGFTGNSNDLLYVGPGANLSIGSGAGTLNLTLGQAGNLNINGAASISSAVNSSYATTLTGSGTLTLSGANTFSGGLTVSNGTLSQTAGTISMGALTVGGGSNNATFNLSGGILNGTSATISAKGTYSQSGGAATFVSLNASSAAAFSFNGGSITINGGTCTLPVQPNPVFIGSNAWVLSGSAAPSLAFTSGGGGEPGGAADGIVGINGGAGSVFANGSGSRLAGIENIVLGDYGSTTGGVFTPSTGFLDLSNSATESSPYLYIGYGEGQGTLTIQSGASVNCLSVVLGYSYATGTITASGGGASQGSLAIGSDGGTGTFTLGIQGQTDSSSWQSSQTTVGGNSAGAYGIGTINLNPGTTLNAGFLLVNTYSGSLSGTGGGTVNINGATLNASALKVGVGGAVNWSSGTFNPGPITQAGGTINNTTGQPLTIGSSGAITTSYTQTGGSYSGDLAINNGGTFYGVNASGNVAVNSGGTIGAPSTAIATLSTGNQTWSSGATYVWKFNLKGAGTGTTGTPVVQNPTGGSTAADQIDTSALALPSGLVTINLTGFNGSQGTAFNSNLNYAWAVADVKSATNLTGFNPQLIVLNTSNAGFATTPASFSISDAPDGAGGEDLIISYNGAPEPTSAVLLGASAPLVLLRRRR